MKTLEKNSFNDNLIMNIHVSYILATFISAIIFPFYVPAFLIITHAIHEKYTGDCLLSIMQRESGYAEEDEDFFHYLFRRKGIDADPKFTQNIHIIIKTVILIMTLYKLYLFIKERSEGDYKRKLKRYKRKIKKYRKYL